MGAAEAAEVIGVAVPNLSALVGMPEPVAYLRATRVWLADDIREFAIDYQSREQVLRHKRKGSYVRQQRR